MTRFDGTAARQLDLIEDQDREQGHRPAPRPERPVPALRLLRRDVYAELERRRRRAQIRARRML